PGASASTLSVVKGLRRDRDGAARVGILQCVVDQVDEHLADARSVCLRIGQAEWHSGNQGDAACLCKRAKPVEDDLDQSADIRRFGVELYLARFNAGKLKQLRYHLCEMIDLARYASRKGARGGRIVGKRRSERLGQELEGSQRGAQLM